VNLEEFCYEEYPEETEKMTFLVIGRLMKDKGTDEVLEAAEIIKKEYPDISIKLLGSYDGNYEEKVNEAVAAGFVEYLGWQENVHGFIKDCHAAIHASYHEGMSNVLLETAATGRPVIAADIPGCREIFDDGMTGIAFQPKSVEALVGAVRKFILLPYEEKRKMGMAGRKKIEKEFDRKTVVRSYLREIELLRTQQL
jgi:galacturonosyltransferase